LRAKVKIESGTDRLVAYAVDSHLARDQPLRHLEHGPASLINWPGTNGSGRTLMLAAPADSVAADSAISETWHLDDIRAGLPQVYPQTHELFVAQMLNLDLLNAISFEKGCYTGQEIIARTHYRGSIKRRMFRFVASCPPPAPATRIVVDGAHAGDVVDSAATPEGCEFLAVVGLQHAGGVLHLDGLAEVELRRAGLPYVVPA